MPHHQLSATLQLLIPLLILVPVLYLRMRKLSKAQPLKWKYLWVRPLIFLGFVALALAPAPPHDAMAWGWMALAAGLGAVAGWHFGRTMAIEMHPENGTLMVKGSQAAMLVLVVLVLLRLGLNTGLRAEASAWHLNMVLITDVSIVFSAALFSMRSLEMYLRARRVMRGAGPAVAGPTGTPGR